MACLCCNDGRGFTIGFSPRMFSVVDQARSDRLPEFVGPVRYAGDELRASYQTPVHQAASIFFDTINANADLMADKAIGFPFMQELARELIASPLIWRALTTKHPAYEHEREVRLVITGTSEHVRPHVTTRLRGRSEIVPYIAQPIPVREPNNILEVIVGPAAVVDAERTVRTLLHSLGVNANEVHVFRSSIPYRAL